MPPAGDFPPEESHQSPPGFGAVGGGTALAGGWSCLRRVTFHRGKVTKTRRGLRPPDPVGLLAAVRRM